MASKYSKIGVNQDLYNRASSLASRQSLASGMGGLLRTGLEAYLGYKQQEQQNQAKAALGQKLGYSPDVSRQFTASQLADLELRNRQQESLDQYHKAMAARPVSGQTNSYASPGVSGLLAKRYGIDAPEEGYSSTDIRGLEMVERDQRLVQEHEYDQAIKELQHKYKMTEAQAKAAVDGALQAQRLRGTAIGGLARERGAFGDWEGGMEMIESEPTLSGRPQRVPEISLDPSAVRAPTVDPADAGGGSYRAPTRTLTDDEVIRLGKLPPDLRKAALDELQSQGVNTFLYLNPPNRR